jgi:CO/xanthine dehydrogenase FAD-binding subunit
MTQASTDDPVRSVARPRTVAEACEWRARRRDWTLVAGGTDVMVEVNAGRREPAGWISIRDIAGFDRLVRDGSGWVLGAGCTFATILETAHPELTALVQAARTVGSRQIRAMATIGGNVATASPAADSVPALLCYDAELLLASSAGRRTLPAEGFFSGPKQNRLGGTEMIESVRLPATSGRQVFVKVGIRNAMVISRCSMAARYDAEAGEARVALGAVAPTPRRAPDAELVLRAGGDAHMFADAVVSACEPIDDVRATAAYRRHAIAVVARRVHRWLTAAP